MKDVDPSTVEVSSRENVKRVSSLPGDVELYRCPVCGRVLFAARLLPGCRVERVCKSKECRDKSYGRIRVFEKIA